MTVTALEPEQAELLEDIAAWLSSNVASDPLLFVQQAFAWGEGELSNSTGPEPWQAEILADIRDGLPLGRAIQIAVASGHGVGKTALIAWLVLWAISTFPDTRGIVTAATEPMLITRVRAELRKWLRLFKARSWGRIAVRFGWRKSRRPRSRTIPAHCRSCRRQLPFRSRQVSCHPRAADRSVATE